MTNQHSNVIPIRKPPPPDPAFDYAILTTSVVNSALRWYENGTTRNDLDKLYEAVQELSHRMAR